MPTREGDRHPRVNASEKAEGPEDARFQDGLGKMITTKTSTLVALILAETTIPLELSSRLETFFIFLLYFGG